MKCLVVSVLTILLYPTILLAQWAPFPTPPLSGGSASYLKSTDAYLYLGGAGVRRSNDGGLTWVLAKGSTPGGVHSIEISDSIVLATGETGVSISYDSGANWKYIGAGLPAQPLYGGLIQDSVLLVGTYSQGVYRSTDRGVSWTQSNDGIKNSSVRAMLSYRRISFVGTGGGLFRSDDDGVSWKPTGSGLTVPYVSSIFAKDSLMIVGTLGGGLFRSTDFGGRWTKCDDNAPNAYVNQITDDGPTLIAATDLGVLVSHDSGAHWSAISTKATFDALSVLERDGMLFVGTGEGLFCTSDTLIHWRSCGYAPGHITMLSFINDTLYAATKSGPYRTTDHGDHWESIGTDLTRKQVNSIVALGSSTFAGIYGGILRSAATNPVWTPADTMLKDQYVSVLTTAKGNLIAGTINNGAFYSADSGSTWQRPSGLDESQGVQSFASIGGVVYGATNGYGLKQSTDGGRSWSDFAFNTSYAAIPSLVSDGMDLYCLTNGKTVYHSSDLGITWSSSNLGDNNYLTLLAAKGASVVVGNTNGQVYGSKDHGQSWRILGSVFSLSGLAIVDDRILAATGSGLYSLPLSNLAVDEPPQESELSVFPNPAGDIVQVANIPRSCNELRISDALGHQVQSISPRGTSSVSFDLRNQPAGIYFITAYGAASIHTRKVTHR